MEAGTGARTPDGIEQAGVERWFAEHVEGSKPPLTFEIIAGGRSNLTYCVTDAAGGSWALRRPPMGATLGSAHDMGREYRIQSALQGASVPVPRLAGFCEDESVTGAPFYVMDFVAGPILRSPGDAEVFGEDERRAIGERVIDTLAAVHAMDPDEIGLGDLGKKTDYVARILRRWSGQWEQSKTRELPLVEELHDRLAARIPAEGPAALVHGDYRLDNVILTDDGHVASVLDWELCTLGDPLADLGMLLVYWCEPDDDFVPLIAPATTAPGFIGREAVKARYAERSGRDISDIDYHVALAYWKLAIILEGVYGRFMSGGYGEDATRDEGARRMARTVEQLTEAADAVERSLGN